MSKRDLYPNLWFPFTYYQDLLDYPPAIIEHGRGIYLYDNKGKGYLDAIGSWWVSILGHNHPEISAAVREQLEKIEHVLMAGFVTQPAIDLSELLISLAPKGLTRVFFSDDGSTAVEAALKIALQYWALCGKKRTEFAAFDGAYHGDTLGAMSVGMIPQYHAIFHEGFKRSSFTDAPYCYRCPCGKEQLSCRAECMDSLERILQERGEHIAACIFEPMVQGAAGMRIYPAKVLQRVFELCAAHDVLTIADEVAMGFGRTGKLFGCDYAVKTPDIMCVAKGLTGGYLPMAATIVREEIFDRFCGGHGDGRIFHHGHSFTGNPLAAAAGCAALRIIQRECLPFSAESNMRHFADGLNEFSALEVVGDIRSIGMVGAIELVADRQSKRPFPAQDRIAFKIARNAVASGLLLRPLGDVLYFMPPLNVSGDEIDNMFSLAQRAIKRTMDEINAGS